MSMQQHDRLPAGMMLFDNQQGDMSDSNGPRVLDIRETVALLQPNPKHHRSAEEALRIAARADAAAKGKELAIESVLHTNSSVAKIHEKEQRLIQKLSVKVDS